MYKDNTNKTNVDDDFIAMATFLIGKTQASVTSGRVYVSCQSKLTIHYRVMKSLSFPFSILLR